MKIVIDMSNSPHVLFFNPIIKELTRKGHEIRIIAREHAQTIELLKLFKLDYEIVGKHAGKSLHKKLINSFSRVFQIKKILKKENPDVCVSHQSPYLIYAAFFSGIKSVYIFDNEHAKLQNSFTFPLAKKVMCPECINVKGKKFIKYPGVKEAVYLRDIKDNFQGLEQIKKISKKKIFIRTEISNAAYMQADSLYELVKRLSENKKYQIIVSPRNKEQIEEYKKIKGIIVLEKPVDGPTIMKNVDLVMSGGGTMNREATVLGTPVISLYPGELLEVDKYLIEKGLMIHDKNPSIELIEKVINTKQKKTDLEKLGKSAMDLIVKEIESV